MVNWNKQWNDYINGTINKLNNVLLDFDIKENTIQDFMFSNDFKPVINYNDEINGGSLVNKYNELTVVKEPIQKHDDINASKVKYKAIKESFGSGTILKNGINVILDEISYKLSPKLKITTTASNGIEITNSNVTNYCCIHAMVGASASDRRYDPATFLSIMNRESADSNYRILFSQGSGNYVYFDYDFGISVSAKFNYYVSTNTIKFYTSNNGTAWEEIGTASANTNKTINITNTRYFRMEGPLNYSPSIHKMYFTNVTASYDYTVYNNSFNTKENLTKLANNQRLLVEIPSIADLDDVISNTVINITCDTLLQPNTKYGLKYNGVTNKIELDELMNNPKILFDITLTEEASQIDFPGISDKLQKGKIYFAEFKGKTLSTLSSCYFGSGIIGTISYSGFDFFPMLIFPYVDSGVKKLKISNNVGYNYTGVNSTLTGYEYLRVDSSPFAVGTRIIIKEIG